MIHYNKNIRKNNMEVDTMHKTTGKPYIYNTDELEEAVDYVRDHGEEGVMYEREIYGEKIYIAKIGNTVLAFPFAYVF